MNLAGLCCGAPADCVCQVGVIGPNPPIPPSGFPLLLPGQQGDLLDNYYAKEIGGALYRIGAAIGCKAICPHLGFIAGVVAEKLGVPKSLSIPGFAVAIASDLLIAAVVEDVKTSVCVGCT